MPAKKPKKDWSAINSQIKNRKSKFKKDERIYELTFSDKNQAKVVMRFLDSRDTDSPYVTVGNHFFNDIGGWYINNCPTTAKDKGPCPVCDDLYTKDYYNTDNDLYYSRKKKTNHYTNVLIIEDKNKPENEGKVFILKFGVKIMEKIDDAIDDGKYPWDDNVGVNFTYSAKKKGKMINYDASYFSDSSTSLDEYGDEEKINSDVHELATFIDSSAFKTYDELKTKYGTVTGESTSAGSAAPQRTKKVVEEDDQTEEEEVIDDFEDDDDDIDTFFDDLQDDD